MRQEGILRCFEKFQEDIMSMRHWRLEAGQSGTRYGLHKQGGLGAVQSLTIHYHGNGNRAKTEFKQHFRFTQEDLFKNKQDIIRFKKSILG